MTLVCVHCPFPAKRVFAEGFLLSWIYSSVFIKEFLSSSPFIFNLQSGPDLGLSPFMEKWFFFSLSLSLPPPPHPDKVSLNNPGCHLTGLGLLKRSLGQGIHNLLLSLARASDLCSHSEAIRKSQSNRGCVLIKRSLGVCV